MEKREEFVTGITMQNVATLPYIPLVRSCNDSNAQERTAKYISLSALKIAILKMREIGGKQCSWGKIGDFYGVTKATVWGIANEDYDPKDAVIRAILHLPPLSTVTVVGPGAVPDGTQVLAARQCRDCGKPYVPNTPTRVKCYECQKVRTRKDRVRE
jgi:hypothetical protein